MFLRLELKNLQEERELNMHRVEGPLASGANQVYSPMFGETYSKAVEKNEIRIGPLIQSAKFDGAVILT